MVLLNINRPADPETNPLDSLLDLLNRDQRTTITINRKSRCDGVASSRRVDFGGACFENSRSLESSYGFNNKIRRRSRGSRLSASIPRLMCRLGEVFIVGVCLLTVVRVPTVMSAPSTRHGKAEQIHSHKQTEDTLSLMHPCGKSHEEEMNNTYYKMSSKESNTDTLNRIITQTKNALDYAETFRDKYVEETFHSPFERHHAQWASQRYEWLPNEVNEIPKKLGQDVNVHHLQSKSIDEFLINIYEYLQKFAVALEQVVVDQMNTQGEFRDNFRRLEVRLKHVRCEIRKAMMQRNIAPREQVPRSIMQDNIRQLEHASYRNVRDWFIFRDLMNALEYVIQVFSFIEKNLPRTSAPASS